MPAICIVGAGVNGVVRCWRSGRRVTQAMTSMPVHAFRVRCGPWSGAGSTVLYSPGITPRRTIETLTMWPRILRSVVTSCPPGRSPAPTIRVVPAAAKPHDLDLTLIRRWVEGRSRRTPRGAASRGRRAWRQRDDLRMQTAMVRGGRPGLVPARRGTASTHWERVLDTAVAEPPRPLGAIPAGTSRDPRSRFAPCGVG